jgi:hypothetical protein
LGPVDDHVRHAVGRVGDEPLAVSGGAGRREHQHSPTHPETLRAHVSKDVSALPDDRRIGKRKPTG